MLKIIRLTDLKNGKIIENKDENLPWRCEALLPKQQEVKEILNP